VQPQTRAPAAFAALAAAVLAAGLAVINSIHWVDVDDSTCGPLYRPSMWLTGEHDPDCAARMWPRAGAVVLLLVVAAGLTWFGVRLAIQDRRERAE
jgi:hypothetical protein